MVNYDLRIEKQKIFGADKIAIAANANETVSFRFSFDANWRIFDSKAAIFKTFDDKYYIIEIKGLAVTVPWEVLCVDHDFKFSVIGYEKEKVLTAGSVDIRVVSSLLPEDCKTFSKTETLFDKFIQNGIDIAYKKYKDEIESLKYSYETKIVNMGAQINAANENTKNVEKAKDDEIKEIRQDHAAQVYALNTEIAEINATLAETKVKADKWALIENAVGDKSRANYALWCGGTKKYKLPFLNTKSMSTISAGNFDDNCTELGFDCSSLREFIGVFTTKTNLERIELRNTHNITSFLNAFSYSTSLREIILGDLTSCSNIKMLAVNCTSLEKITIGQNAKIQDFSSAFSGCISLREISGTLNFIVQTNVSGTFDNCTSLEKVRFTEESIGMAINLGSCRALSKESMLSLFNALRKVNDKKITFSKYAFDNNFPTETEQNEIIKSITQKGWYYEMV